MSGPYFARKDHYTIGDLYSTPGSESTFLHQNPLVPGMQNSLLFLQGVPSRWPDPVYTITRTFGSNGRTQSIPFAVADANASSITLDGKGAGDTYSIEQGVGSFLDIAIDDSDSTTQNAATVLLGQPDIVYYRAALTDNSVSLEYFTLAVIQRNCATQMLEDYPQFYNLQDYYALTESVYYSPTISFGSNVDLGLDFYARFHEFVINRPTAPQNVTVRFSVFGTPGSDKLRLPSFDDVTSLYKFPLFVYDPDGPSSEIINLATTGGPGRSWRLLLEATTLEVQANASNLMIEMSIQTSPTTPAITYPLEGQWLVNVRSNSGTLTFRPVSNIAIALSDIETPDTFSIFENSGTISFNFGLRSSGSNISKVVNILSNRGTINAASDRQSLQIAQFNLGDDGSLANVQGTVHFTALGLGSPSASPFNVVIDDRNNSTTDRKWMIDSEQATIGDLSVAFPEGFYGQLAVAQRRQHREVRIGSTRHSSHRSLR